MINVVVVSDKITGNIYYLDPNNLDLKRGNLVIFDTENGLLSGVVVKENYEEKKSNLILPLTKVLRIANKKDLKIIEDNSKEADKALNIAKKYAKELELDMNFVDCYYTYDQAQLVFSFLSDNRVDFRELAKKLASKYKTRIELRQIGVRDKSKKIGGLGPNVSS